MDQLDTIFESNEAPEFKEVEVNNTIVEDTTEPETEVVRTTPTSKSEILEALKEITLRNGKDISREEVSKLKQMFFNFRKEDIEKEKASYIEGGGNPEEFEPSQDVEEQQMLMLVTEIKEKKTAWAAERDEALRKNFVRKEEIIDEIAHLASDTDNVNRSFNRFKELQQEFKTIGEVPQENTTETWKKYQDACEHFYDQLKINQELRDYDFKKNLEIKTLICEKAEYLAGLLENIEPESSTTEAVPEQQSDTPETENKDTSSEADFTVIEAFRQLQDLHEKWKITGPVAKEQRDIIWNRFKDASVKINKRYQSFFEERKANERANEEAKTALCEKIEAIDTDSFKGAGDWDKATEEVIALQAEWKKIGFIPRRNNNALYNRFRKACDEFFTKKGEFFQALKTSQADNLAKKTALAERAEALKDSTDWKKTGEELARLQKEWKEIGPVPRRQSEALWQRFHSSCEAFYELRKKNHSESRKQETSNLKDKEAILAEMNKVLENNVTDNVSTILNDFQKRWKEIGHVPFKEKDRINETFRTLMSKIRKKFDLSSMKASIERFETSLEELGSNTDKLQRERDRLSRILENKKAEKAICENNLGFFTSKSKNGSGLLKEVERKMELINKDIDELEQKIALIDEKI